MENLLTQESMNLSSTLKDWQKGYDSQPQEYEYWIENVEGTIPPDLKGTLFRNGPGLLDIGDHALSHPFDGDGMICAIAFQNGRAHFRNRFVQTEGYLAEQKAQTILYRGFGTQKPGGWLANIFDLKFKNAANTNVICWNGKLWAMWEGGEPYRLDPVTLETLGIDNLGGILQPNQPFSAHPKIIKDRDGQTVFVNFGVQLGLSNTLTVFEIDSQEKLLNHRTHKIPGFPFLHDILVTPNYYIFIHSPFTLDALPFVLGQRSISECFRFDPQQSTQIILIPRHGNQEVQTLETDAFFTFHHGNAWEEDGNIYLDSVCYDSYPDIEPETDFRTIDFIEFPKGKLWRLQINLTAKTVEHHILEHRSCEMPAIHPNAVGSPYRYLYLNVTDQLEGNEPLQAVLKMDLQAGKQQMWSAAPRGFVGEPVFVPRPHSVDEDDGWLLTLVYDAAEHRSDLVILDARDLTSEPLAKLHLNHHVPHGFHGNWTSQCYV